MLTCKKTVEEFSKILEGDEKIGAEIVLHSLEAPIRQIAKNAGIDDGVVVEKVLEKVKKKYNKYFENDG